MIEGNGGVKCGLAVRRFKDKFQDPDAYAGAISRRGQRLVNAVATENPEFILFSFDVSQAFATGKAFEELSALSGQDIRKVELDAPKAGNKCLRFLLDFKDFDPAKEEWTMLEPIYGLNGALRAWRKKLHQVLVQWLSCRQLYIEPELTCVHRKRLAEEPDIITRATEHDEEQRETGRARNTQPQAYEKGNLQCLVSVHVGDINGVATREVADRVLGALWRFAVHES